MDDRRGLRSLVVVAGLIGIVAATTLVSCGGSDDGSSNGNLCEQCGDTDGPCNAAGADPTGDDRPSFCTTDPCHVQLTCVRKVDSGQRRCFPADPATHQLDLRYECDGSRPIESFAPPTATPVPSATSTPAESSTPSSTAPTATAPTPSATGPTPSGSATPATTATPSGGPADADVDVVFESPDGESDLPSSFTATVTYPAFKGNFLADGAADCDASDDGFTVQDNGNGVLSLTFSGDTEGVSDVTLACTFHQVEGQTLADVDLSANPTNGLTTTIDVF
jgi:hypothetical protein